MTAPCVRREKAALSSGCKSHLGERYSSRKQQLSSHGGEAEMAEAAPVWLVTAR